MPHYLDELEDLSDQIQRLTLIEAWAKHVAALRKEQGHRVPHVLLHEWLHKRLPTVDSETGSISDGQVANMEHRLDHDAVSASQQKIDLLLPPGARLRAWLGLVYSDRTLARVLEPILADMQHEWLEAHQAGRLGRARWIHVRGIFNLLFAVAMRIPLSAVRWVWEAWKKTKLG